MHLRGPVGPAGAVAGNAAATVDVRTHAAAYNALATKSFWPRPASAPIARTARLKARVVLSSSDRGRR